MRFIMQPSFLKLWCYCYLHCIIWIEILFYHSVCAGNNGNCFRFARHWSICLIFQISFNMQQIFLGLEVSVESGFSKIAWLRRDKGKLLITLRNLVFLKMRVILQISSLRLSCFKCSCVLLIAWFWQKYMVKHTSCSTETTASACAAEESQFSSKWDLSCK